MSPKTAALKVSKVGAFGRLASDEVGDGAEDGSTAETKSEKTRLEALSFIFGPEIGRDYPLNLSISLSGGKETNKDSLSNGE